MSQARGKEKPKATRRPSFTHLTFAGTRLDHHGNKAGRKQALAEM